MSNTIFKHILAFTAIFATEFLPAFAHEYWIEPEKYEIAVGEVLSANLRNGQHYKGNKLYYLKQRFKKFEVYNNGGVHAITGSDGDQPAAKFRTSEEGLHILSYQSVFDSITMKNWDKFAAYLKHQGLNDIEERHKKRGLWMAYVHEDYARNVKALVKVGDGKGSDHLTDLPYQFVAQDNPYTMKMTLDKPNFLNVRLYLEGKPQADRKILIFQNNGKITEGHVRTDANGFAKIPLAGGGKFMLSSVYMFDGDDDPTTKIPEWYSYWANLTFETPITK